MQPNIVTSPLLKEMFMSRHLLTFHMNGYTLPCFRGIVQDLLT
jgi:hypothetical protein